MERSQPYLLQMIYSFWRLTIALSVLLSPLSTLSMASEKTTDMASKSVAVDPALLESLLQEKSIKPLLQHHRIALTANNSADIACELLTLTRGKAWQKDPVSFLSAHEINANGNKNFQNALTLGHWLGSVQTVINEQGFSALEAADWFKTQLTIIEQRLQSMDTSIYQGLVPDIANKRITLNEAMELLAYSKVTSSTVTTVIG
ncbi:MAG: hypothetical protein AB8B79_03295, partial [Granulosicoccus sp.]